jgi:hypothetical protein
MLEIPRLVSIICMVGRWMWILTIGGMVTEENVNTHGETCHIATFPTTNPT